MTIIELLGCVGLTLAITNGSIFDGPREWMLGFSNPWNVFRLFGTLLGCPVCLGVWIGAGWAVASGQVWVDWFVFAGLVSLSALVVDMLLVFVGALHDRLSGHSAHDNLVNKLMLMAKAKQGARSVPKAIPQSEEEADALADEMDRIKDQMAGY